MKRLFYYLLCISIIGIFTYLIFVLIKEHENTKLITLQLKEISSKDAEKENIIENIIVISKLQYFVEGKMLDNCLLYDSFQDSVTLKKILSDKPKMIYVFSEQSCSICYIPFLKKLDLLSETIGEDNIILIGKFSNSRNLKIFINENSIKHAIYRIESDMTIFPEYNEYAMAFLLSKDMIIDKFIITDRTNTQLSDNYLKLIEKQFVE